MDIRRRFALGIPGVALVIALGTIETRPPAHAYLAAQSAATAQPAQTPAIVELPNRENSLKFAVLGDFGTGDREQYQLAEQMTKLRARFPFELVLTVGDNIYGGERPQDMKRKFEDPYKALLDGGVKFYASLGNHDSRDQAKYKLFNMDGKTYYTMKAPKEDVRFFALESDYLNPEQVAWLEKGLQSSGERWNIPYFHHPLYSSGKRHGSDPDLRGVLEPMFLKYGVSVVFAGHDHFYERTKPQQGIVYFVTGSGGQLRRGNIDRKSGIIAVGIDNDQVFLAVEIDDDQMFFNAISRQGLTVDSGVIERRKPAQSQHH
jgi:hypothetical protein